MLSTLSPLSEYFQKVIIKLYLFFGVNPKKKTLEGKSLQKEFHLNGNTKGFHPRT